MAPKYADTKAEIDAFEAEVKGIQEWWQTDRQKHIKRYSICDWLRRLDLTDNGRPYTAESIAALRNIGFKTEYPSSVQGRKLWRLLNEHNAKGTYELTFGTTEPMIAKEMPKAGSKIPCT
jgi:isocitrate lyase